MLIYDVNSLPDITLSKYQALEDSGIESMLESQTRLLRQLYRFAAYGKIAICSTTIHVVPMALN